MSLINDALKKAQKQREMASGATPPPGMPPPPAPPSATPSPAPVPSGGKNFTLLIAGAAVLVSLSVAVTVYLLRGPRTEPRVAASGPIQTSSPVVTPSVPPVVKPSSSPATTTSAAPANPNPIQAAPSLAPVSLPAASATKSASSSNRSDASKAAPPPVSFTPPAPTSSPTIPAAEPISRPAPAVEAPPLKITFRIQGMVDKFRVSGIRLSDTGSKVILNDHLFELGDLIEPSLGLRLTKIESHLLTFVDADGNKYLKRF